MAEVKVLVNDTDTTVVITSEELTQYDNDVTDGDVPIIQGKVGETQRQLRLTLRRYDINPDDVATTGELVGGDPRQTDLQDIGAAMWLEAVYRHKAVVVDEDEGFGAKQEYWEAKMNDWIDKVIGTDPHLVTLKPSPTPSDPKPGMNLRTLTLKV